MNDVIKLKNNNINNIINNLKILVKNINTNIELFEKNNKNIDTKIQTSNFTNNINNIIVDKLKVINYNLDTINIDVLELLTELDNNNITELSNKNEDIINYNKSKEIMKPFLPYMLLYSIIYEKNI